MKKEIFKFLRFPTEYINNNTYQCETKIPLYNEEEWEKINEN